MTSNLNQILRDMILKLGNSTSTRLPVSDFHAKQFLNIDIQKGCAISSDSLIGEYTYIGMNTTVTKSVIGRYCSIANNVSIGDGEHTLDRISTSSLFYNNAYEELTKNKCVIGNDVWIGTKSIVRRGVVIGDGAVVGANSFVNKDVPNFSVVVGTPAKIIKYRFSETIIDLVNKSKWWELDIESAKVEIMRLEHTIQKLKFDSNL